MQIKNIKSYCRGLTGQPLVLAVAFVLLTACAQGQAPRNIVVYEGARLIIGNGSVIENGMFTVSDNEITAVGEIGAYSVPEAATRVNLAGMTVMPAIVDAHTHMTTSRDTLIEDLQRRAYFGVGAAISMGSDGPDAPLG